MSPSRIKTISSLLEHRIEENGQQTAFIEDGNKYSYFDLGAQVSFYEKELVRNKIHLQDKVAILTSSNFKFIASFFSILKVGAIALPLNKNYKKQEIQRYLEDAQVGYYISDRVRRIKSRKDVTKGNQAWLRSGKEAVHLFSSGSAGIPKRVGKTHYNILAEAESFSSAVGLSPKDRILCPLPLFHAYGFNCGMIASIYAGSTLVLVKKFNPRSILDLLEKEDVSIFLGVSYMFDMLSKVSINRKIRIPFLRYCFSSGISLPQEVARKFYSRFGVFPRQLYGTTETGVLTMNLDEDIADSLGSAGKPIGGVSVHLNSSGEVMAKSPSVGKCYNKDNQGKPLLRNGYFYTGDLGEIDRRGNLYLVGRKTSFINVAGTKVDAEEVEMILKKCPAVREAVVVGVPDKLRGEIIKAVVVMKNKSIPASRIRKYCRAKMADFKLPRIIEVRDEIPKSILGKMLRGALINEKH